MEPERVAEHPISSRISKNCFHRKSIKFIFVLILLINIYMFLGGVLFLYIETCRDVVTGLDSNSQEVNNLSSTSKEHPKLNDSRSLREASSKHILNSCNNSIENSDCRSHGAGGCNLSYKHIMEWTIFAWETISTVGYGSKALTTVIGKLLFVPYSTFGIAIYLAFLGITGSLMKSFILKCIRFFEGKLLNRVRIRHKECKVFIVTVMLTFTSTMTNAYIYNRVTGVDLPTSIYFSHCTFSTIGFGDYNMSFIISNPRLYVIMSILTWCGLVGTSTSVQALVDVINQGQWRTVVGN